MPVSETERFFYNQFVLSMKNAARMGFLILVRKNTGNNKKGKSRRKKTWIMRETYSTKAKD